MAHMGIIDLWKEAIDAAKSNKNIWLETSGFLVRQSISQLKKWDRSVSSLARILLTGVKVVICFRCTRSDSWTLALQLQN